MLNPQGTCRSLFPFPVTQGVPSLESSPSQKCQHSTQRSISQAVTFLLPVIHPTSHGHFPIDIPRKTREFASFSNVKPRVLIAVAFRETSEAFD